MRISIREQLACLLILSSLVGLAVISVAIWSTNKSFVLQVAASRLRTAASLKSAQIASNLQLMRTVASFVTTRAVIQDALARYGNGTNITEANFEAAQSDIKFTLGDIGSNGDSPALQAQIFAPSALNRSNASTVVSATGPLSEQIMLPYNYANGTPVYLGDDGIGYPSMLYPNLTFVSTNVNGSEMTTAVYEGEPMRQNSTLVLGPLIINSTYSLLSFTVPVLNTTFRADILGWLTVVMDASLIQSVINAPEGLGDTGYMLLLGPTSSNNIFPRGIVYDEKNGTQIDNYDVRYLFPLNSTAAARHPDHVVGTRNAPFPAKAYPAVEQAISQWNDQIDNSGTMLSTYNEANDSVSVGFSLAPSPFVDWVIIVEQAKSEVFQPIYHLRNIILACLFGVAGFFCLVSFPLAHLAILPIRRLRTATAESIDPPMANDNDLGQNQWAERSASTMVSGAAEKNEVAIIPMSVYGREVDPDVERRIRENKPFSIPNKVRVRKHFIHDELTDLTSTYNEMSDELFVHYARLEERVRMRTIELEQSKKAAEAANESKTHFIANISHELKTPLNGILGMCAVCMQEEDTSKIKQSLGIIYKSGDLLLKLLTDLLTFSRNQVEKVMTLDEREFRLRDVEEQIQALFGCQAKEKGIDLQIKFEGNLPHWADSSSAMESNQTGLRSETIRDQVFWGDVHRILQVVINLVSNSVKFTPKGGRVILTIRCISTSGAAGLSHSASRASAHPLRRQQSLRFGDTLQNGTANLIRPVEQTNRGSHDPTMPLPAGRDVDFDFEVQDTGPGISAEMHQRIFEPFVQGSIGLARKHGGTGLGLSICSQLAGLMGGTMSVSSALGEGSTFCMHVPLRHVQFPVGECSQEEDARARDDVDARLDRTRRWTALQSQDKAVHMDAVEFPETTSSEEEARSCTVVGTASSISPDTPAPTPPLETALMTSPDMSPPSSAAAETAASDSVDASARPIRVLVAEDNKVNQEVVRRMLRLEKITDVTIANDGQEALDLVKASIDPCSSECVGNTYDIIFMDVQMPNMDGLTSTKLIRALDYNKPIVALTAFAEESNVQDCYASGMDKFLAKPIKRPLLKKVLAEYCSQRSFTSSNSGSSKEDAQGSADAVADATPSPSSSNSA